MKKPNLPKVPKVLCLPAVPLQLANQVDQLAAKLERSRGWMLKQALAAYVEREADRHRMTIETLGDVDAQNGVSHDGVKAWASSPLTPCPPF